MVHLSPVLPNQRDSRLALPPRVPAPTPDKLSKYRLLLAFVVAGVSDGLSAWLTFIPPLELGLDLATALLLFVILGWRWIILPGLVMEAIPGLSVFPFWVLVVVAVAVWGTARPSAPETR